jgi:hypothetical protein
MKLHKDDCNHPPEAYLGSDKTSDYYLYNEHGISICRRHGELGNYETINYTYHPEYFIDILTRLEASWKHRVPIS